MTKISLSILSGILVMFSFPTVLFGWYAPNLGVLGWVALVPLFIAISDAKPSRAYLLTFISGLFCFGGSLYWIFRAVHVYGGISVGLSTAITVLLVIILSAYIAFAPMLAKWIQEGWKGEMLVLLPVVWVVVEYARGHVPMGGFPWANIAMSQWNLLVPLQMVDLVGVYGLIFVMVWVNWFIAELIIKLSGRDIKLMVPKFIITVVLMVLVMVYGSVTIRQQPKAERVSDIVSIGIIQGNIPQEQKWDPKYVVPILNAYREWTEKIFNSGVDLIIWPEASFPRMVSDEITSADPRVFGLPEGIQGDLPSVMVGAIVYGLGTTVYNSALLFSPGGKLIGRYDKRHLVPLGEYVPYKKLLFFARKLTAPVGDFKPGESFKPMAFPMGMIGPLICYEDVFPEISRNLANRGANILVNLTNDAWYGVTSAPYQHLALSVFRAVENRRYMVRSTNTGVSAIVAPTGEVLMDSPLFERLAMVGAVLPIDKKSFYTKNGDWFVWACMGYTALGIVLAGIMRIRRRKGKDARY